MVLLSALVLLSFSIFTTVVRLHLTSSGIDVVVLLMDWVRSVSHLWCEQGSCTPCLHVLKITWLHICRIILYCFYYKNSAMCYSAARSTILKYNRLQPLLCCTYNPGLWANLQTIFKGFCKFFIICVYLPLNGYFSFP